MPGKNPLTEATTSTLKKRKTGGNATDSQPERNSRSKNTMAPNRLVSVAGTESAKPMGESISEQKIITEVVIPMDDEKDSKHERVLFIDDHTKMPAMALYRTTEKAEPMAHLWAEFMAATQDVRDHVGLDILGSFLSAEEADAIDLMNNHHIFPTLITSRGALETKYNIIEATQASRNGGQFAKGTATASATTSKDLEHRATAMRIKAAAFTKQADAYEKAALAMEEAGIAPPEEIDDKNMGMVFLGEAIPLKRVDLNRYITQSEDHLMIRADMLRGELSNLAAYINEAEKRLRDLIQLKVAADMKLCRDVKKFEKFEMQAWQMEVLPTGTHLCQCSQCVLVQPGRAPGRVPYKFPDNTPDVAIEDAEQDIKIEEEQVVSPDAAVANGSTKGNGDGSAVITSANVQQVASFGTRHERVDATANDTLPPKIKKEEQKDDV